MECSPDHVSQTLKSQTITWTKGGVLTLDAYVNSVVRMVSIFISSSAAITGMGHGATAVVGNLDASLLPASGKQLTLAESSTYTIYAESGGRIVFYGKDGATASTTHFPAGVASYLLCSSEG